MATPANRFQLLILAAAAAEAEAVLAVLKRAKLPVRGAFSQNPKSLIRAKHCDLILACIGDAVPAARLSAAYNEIEQRIPLLIIAPPGDLDGDALQLMRTGASGLLTPGDDVCLVERIRREIKIWYQLRQLGAVQSRLKRSEQQLQALLKAGVDGISESRQPDHQADSAAAAPPAAGQNNLIDLLSPEYRQALEPLLRDQQAPPGESPDSLAPVSEPSLSPPSMPEPELELDVQPARDPEPAPGASSAKSADLPPLTLASDEAPLPDLADKPQALSGHELTEEELIAQIERALQDGSFKLAYQPVISLRGDSQEKYSVLLRLLDDNRTYRAADDLLEPAARSGRLPEVDRWVIQNALTVLSTRRQAGQRAHFFLNLSAALLSDPDLLLWIYDQLRQHGIRGNWVSFQVREEDARQHLDLTASLASGLKQIKSSLTISQFGLNTDSELLLNDIPIEFIKLGPDLTSGLGTDSLKQSRVKHLFDAARQHQVRSIAGCVEDERTLASIWSAGADYVQGKLLGRPSSVLELND